ncbi:MAG TPA: hypothetical protein VKY74_27145 [Chloroflexia bacterium]|nr:hypothetical protein [Chloroflexia bacterium]
MSPHAISQAIYCIQLAEPLSADEALARWFAGLTICTTARAGTVLLTPAIDQPALHAILATLRDLAIPLRAVRHVPCPAEGGEVAALASLFADL